MNFKNVAQLTPHSAVYELSEPITLFHMTTQHLLVIKQDDYNQVSVCTPDGQKLDAPSITAVTHPWITRLLNQFPN